MRRNLPILFVLAFVLLGAGCASLSKRTALNEQDAAALAVRLANQEARKRFQVEPFGLDSGALEARNNRWSWQALTSTQGQDAVAKITFDLDGRKPEVFVDLQVSRVSAPRFRRPLPGGSTNVVTPK